MQVPEDIPFTRRQLRRQRRFFISGPIPIAWLARAGALPGKALHAGLGLWFFANMRRTREVAVSQSVIAHLFELTPASTKRGLRALERAGLVRVRRAPGRKNSFELLEVVEVVR